MAYTPPPGSGTSGGRNGNGLATNGNGTAVKERVKSLTYSATVNKLLLDVEADTTEGSVKEGTIGDLKIKNTGNHPAFAILAYRLWTDATTMSGNTYHLNCLLKPGEEMYVPDTPVVIADETIEQLAGTAVSNAAPDANEYTDSTADADNTTATDNVIGDDDDTTLYLEPYTSAANCTANLFRIGDLVRVRDEVMEVTAIGDKSDLANNTLTVKRGVYGSTAVTAAADDDAVRFPFFNAYHDYDKYTKAQTDSNGKFKCFNFFGQGRALTGIQGLTPGSIAIKFYNSAYQELGLSGITSGTNSGLTASTEYKLDITVDGGTLFQDLSITTDSSNLNFGGTNGVISKIQAALDTQYYTAGNLFEKKVTVGIVNGDIRFTSGSHLSTGSIRLTDTGDAASFIDAAANGRIPAIANIPDAVDARLPDDTIYDRVTYASSPNEGAFLFDDGNGRLWGVGSGTINYETGAIDMIGCPPNAEFVYSCLHTSAFSGKRNATDSAKMNSLKGVYGNMPNQKGAGQLTVTRM